MGRRSLAEAGRIDAQLLAELGLDHEDAGGADHDVVHAPARRQLCGRDRGEVVEHHVGLGESGEHRGGLALGLGVPLAGARAHFRAAQKGAHEVD